MINRARRSVRWYKKRPLVIRVKETINPIGALKILVSQTSFKVNKFEMVDKSFVGARKAFGKRIAQGVLQRIIDGV